MSSKFDKFHNILANLPEQLNKFKVDFKNRNDFKDFAFNLSGNLKSWNEVYVTGYFSEGARGEFNKIAEWKKLRLICPKFRLSSERNRSDLQALRKLSKVEPLGKNAGVEIKISNMVHARLFVAFNRILQTEDYSGLLVLGSFDFNKEGIAGERFDAGISTQNPDLVKSAIKLFEEIWNDDSSKPLDEAFPE